MEGVARYLPVEGSRCQCLLEEHHVLLDDVAAVACPALGPLGPAGAVAAGWSAAVVGVVVPRSSVVDVVLLPSGGAAASGETSGVVQGTEGSTLDGISCSWGTWL